MEWNLAFEEVEDGWLWKDTQTDFLKFRIDCTHTLTDEQMGRLTDAMVKAGAVEMVRMSEEFA